MIRYIKTFEVIFITNNLSGMHISTMWHSLNVLKYFCPLSVYQTWGQALSKGLKSKPKALSEGLKPKPFSKHFLKKGLSPSSSP